MGVLVEQEPLFAEGEATNERHSVEAGGDGIRDFWHLVTNGKHAAGAINDEAARQAFRAARQRRGAATDTLPARSTRRDLSPRMLKMRVPSSIEAKVESTPPCRICSGWMRI